jgi:hypothetical protein
MEHQENAGVLREPTRKSISEGVKTLEYDDRGIVVRLSKGRFTVSN